MKKSGKIKTSFHFGGKNLRWGIYGLAILVLVLPEFSKAQTCCSGGVPLGSSLGLGAAEDQTFQFLATYDLNVIDDLVSFSELLDDQTRSRTTQSSIFEINYGFNHRFSVTGVVPFVRQTRMIQAFGGAEDFTAVQGPGDVILVLKYRILNPDKNPNLDWVIGAGPKIPTAKTDFTNNQGLVLAADMQPGSGSLDGILWSYILKSHFLKPKLSFLAVTTFRYSGENKNYNSTQTYRFGNEFQFNLGLNYSFFVKWPVDVLTLLQYRKQSVDLINGGVFPLSGGQWIYANPGVSIQFSPGLSFRITGTYPIYRKLEGTQLTTSYKWSASVLFNIPFKKKEFLIN